MIPAGYPENLPCCRWDENGAGGERIEKIQCCWYGCRFISQLNFIKFRITVYMYIYIHYLYVYDCLCKVEYSIFFVFEYAKGFPVRLQQYHE